MVDEKRLPPVLSVQGTSLADTWQKAILSLADNGLVYRRGDEDDSGDQVDSYMTMEFTNPDAEPFSHRFGGTNATDAPALDYAMEVMGAKDSWVKDFSDPKDQRWDYMYHERLGAYPNPTGKPIDQIEFAIKRLIERPSSRRTNIITWYPERDMKTRHTPCLQRQWFQIVNNTLDMHYSFRSRNARDASFGNQIGMYVEGCHIRDRVEQATGKNLAMRMIDTVDSFHVNSGSYAQFQELVGQIKKRQASGGPLTFTREEIIAGMEIERPGVEAAIMLQTAKHFPGNLEEEASRVHAIGDRVLYLLRKYAPK